MSHTTVITTIIAHTITATIFITAGCFFCASYNPFTVELVTLATASRTKYSIANAMLILMISRTNHGIEVGIMVV